ncbi:hypothetical protein QML29_29735, partial [Klebsiella pneumoniae]|uniref:hypothetical protein n=1 Tax=Klebsiella pneumoniae TaxID=573 RepID=UPI003A877456
LTNGPLVGSSVRLSQNLLRGFHVLGCLEKSPHLTMEALSHRKLSQVTMEARTQEGIEEVVGCQVLHKKNDWISSMRVMVVIL